MKKFEKRDLAELGIARENFLEEEVIFGERNVSGTLLVKHMRFCGPNLVTVLQFLMARPNTFTPICK